MKTQSIELGEAKTPGDTRIYAIGDIHGCIAEFDRLLEIIHSDLTSAPIANHLIISLGDYVDRGPDSAGCVEKLIRLQESSDNVVCLKGNHEDKFLKFLNDPLGVAGSFFGYGGIELSQSYGVNIAAIGDPLMNAETVRDELIRLAPQEHLTWLEALSTSFGSGDYFFAHAGVDPGVPLNSQNPHDLMWIREPFLSHDMPLEKVIVHGHTPQSTPEVKVNRINVDTWAFATGVLTCVVLEGTEYRFLNASV